MYGLEIQELKAAECLVMKFAYCSMSNLFYAQSYPSPEAAIDRECVGNLR